MKKPRLKCLNLGAGTNIKRSAVLEEWINLDKHIGEYIDVVADLNDLPLPFRTDEFDIIQANHILEHIRIDTSKFIRELIRITKNGGKWLIKVPHYTNMGFYNEFHNKVFCLWSFENRCGSKGNNLEDNIFDCITIAERKIVFHKGPLIFDHLVERIVNANHFMQKVYEFTFLKYLFPCKEICFRLQVTKVVADNEK